jgi:subtilisin family serine protease
LVQFKSDASVLSESGCEVTSTAGDVAAVFVRPGTLEKLRQHPEIVFVETSCALKDETDVSLVDINLAAPSMGSRIIPGDGRGALIGVIDSGFDLTHPSFLNAQGRTRIRAAWDQVNLISCAGVAPPAFGYGVEYTGATINGHVAAQRPVVVKNHQDAGAHGTYVTGIAAGNGASRVIYRGVAPEAELILVTYRNDVPVGGSAYVLDAIEFIRKHSEALNRPVVINLSQGDNLGAHDGTSLLERAIDHIVDEGRVLVVISAGNECGGPACHHAQGKIGQGEELAVSFTLSSGLGRRVNDDTIEVWYRGGDRFAVALQTPGGERSEFVEPDGPAIVSELHGGGRAYICSQTNHQTNGDNRIRIVLKECDGWEEGSWQLILRGDSVRHGNFDAWADRPNAVTVVGFQSHQSNASTITLPGNSRRAITVGGYVSRPSCRENVYEVKGSFAHGSSVGPTRDGRIKPDLTAPSSLIMAPRMRTNASPPHHDPTSGTSMAAPHVSGVVALLWALRPEISSGQMRDVLVYTARDDDFTGEIPNLSWGYGKLDAGAAYEFLFTLTERRKQTMAETQVIEFETAPKEDRNGELVGMRIKIEVSDDADLLITATSVGDSAGKNYAGMLTLRKVKGGPIIDGSEGGDECWINGVWMSPCPSAETTT